MREARLLGRAVFLNGERQLRSPSEKVLALIAFLSLEGKSSRSSVAALLWVDSIEIDARRNLRQELFRLQRGAFGAWFEVEAESLSLAADVRVDAVRFLELEAASEVELALEEYHGVLLDSFETGRLPAFEFWLQLQRERLETLRRGMLLRLAPRREAAGDLRGALGIHLDLLAGDSLLEFHEREAMRLHARLGEHALALERFNRFRQLLAEELALEPMVETLQLAARIRAGEHLEITGLVPRVRLEQAQSPFVGREIWLERLKEASVLSLILGEPGIGKTRLAEVFAADFSANPAVWVRSSLVSLETPLSGVAAALEQALNLPESLARLRALEESVRSDVARLVPSFQSDTQTRAGDTNQPEYRTRFLRSLARALEVVAGDGGVIVFDDLHWTDSASLEVLELIVNAERVKKASLRVLATARVFELGQQATTNTVLARLERDGELTRIQPEPLSESAVLELLRVFKPQSNDLTNDARQIHRVTAGNPFFVLEMLRHPQPLEFPASLLETIRASVATLDLASKRLLEVACLTEDGFTLETLITATALDEWEGLAGLESLCQARMLETGATSRQVYRFTHDLLRFAMRANLGADRKRLIHKKLAAILETQQMPPAQIAYHLEHALEPAKAAAWRIKAAQASSQLYAYTEALGHYAKALEDGGLTDTETFEVYLAREDCLRVLLHETESIANFEAMLALARRLNDPEFEARALERRSVFQHDFGHHAKAFEDAQTAINLSKPNSALQVRAFYRAGVALFDLGRLEESKVFLLKAYAQSALVTPRIQAGIRTSLCYHDIKNTDYDGAKRFFEEALNLAKLEQDHKNTALAFNAGARLALAQGDLKTTIERLELGLKETISLADLKLQLMFINNSIRVYLEAGDLQAAQSRLEQGLQLAQEPRNPSVEQVLLFRLGGVQVLRGQLGLAINAYWQSLVLAKQIDAVGREYRTCLHALTHLHAQLGNATQARIYADLFYQSWGATYQNGDMLLESDLALCELLEGQKLAARDRLLRILADEENFSEQKTFANCCLGLAYLQLHEPSKALEISKDLNSTFALNALTLSIRLQAEHDLSAISAATIVEAQNLLDSGKVPPLESLELHAALGLALERVSSKKAQYHRIQAQQLSLELANTLELDARVSFVAKWNEVFTLEILKTS